MYIYLIYKRELSWGIDPNMNDPEIVAWARTREKAQEWIDNMNETKRLIDEYMISDPLMEAE